MGIEYGTSRRSNVGLEWELACVDAVTGELSPAAPEVLATLGESEDGKFPQITAEFLTNTIEVVSGPHDRVADAVADLDRMVNRVRHVTDPLGVDLMSAGTHPFSQWFEQNVTPGHDRYATLVDRT